MIIANVMITDQMCFDLLCYYEIGDFNDADNPFRILFVLIIIMEWLK